MEKFCSQGHVLDIGKDTCSRCGGVAVEDIKDEIVTEEEVETPEMEEEAMEDAKADFEAEEKPKKKKGKK